MEAYPRPLGSCRLIKTLISLISAISQPDDYRNMKPLVSDKLHAIKFI